MKAKVYKDLKQNYNIDLYKVEAWFKKHWRPFVFPLAILGVILIGGIYTWAIIVFTWVWPDVMLIYFSLVALGYLCVLKYFKDGTLKIEWGKKSWI